MTRIYVRLKFISQDDENRIVWAEKMQSDKPYLIYSKRNKYGEVSFRRELIILHPKDIVWEKPAQMSKHYGMLEVIQNGESQP